jgi:hypothetical protein
MQKIVEYKATVSYEKPTIPGYLTWRSQNPKPPTAPAGKRKASK